VPILTLLTKIDPEPVAPNLDRVARVRVTGLDDDDDVTLEFKVNDTRCSLNSTAVFKGRTFDLFIPKECLQPAQIYKFTVEASGTSGVEARASFIIITRPAPSSGIVKVRRRGR